MKTQHTPGPWQMAFNGAASTPDWTIYPGQSFKEAIGKEPICFLPSTSTKTAENVTSNARLIAAAPELLEALKDLFHDWMTLVGEDLRENNADVSTLWKQAESALAKATGEKP